HPEKGFEMAERIAFEVNEETRTVEVAPDTPLLYVLRNELGLSEKALSCLAPPIFAGIWSAMSGAPPRNGCNRRRKAHAHAYCRHDVGLRHNGRRSDCHDGGVHAEHYSEVRVPGGCALGS
ncbi:MAG: hypothetical protein WBX30_31450, partial [Stellaceae bacterium]